nr:flagellar brake protein [Burkholderiales bacterium]
LDTGKDPVANRKLLASDRAFFEGRQDKVRVRFRIAGLAATSHRDRPALALPLPRAIFKFQRREYYRVTLPMARPVLCTIPYDDQRAIEATVLDLSVGGVKLGHYPDETPLKVGMTFTGCALALPDAAPMRVGLEVRNNVASPMRNGVLARRAGCRFTELPRGAESAIQKYIIRVEREQRALSAER